MRDARAWPGLAVVSLLSVLTGCPDGSRDIGPPPRDARDALQRVNDNLAGLIDPLYCNCVATFHFRDENGQKRTFLAHPTTLIFAGPRSLYMDIKSLAGSVARIGSNAERYWLWIDLPERRQLYWGAWSRVAELRPERVEFPPSDLLDALMLRPLPEQAGASPWLRIEQHDWRLSYLQTDDAGRAKRIREIVLDVRPPFMPVRIVDRLPDGRVAMDAELGNYQRVGADGPFTARRYVIRWPLNEAELRLDVERAKLRPDQPPFDRFPDDWVGPIECLDDGADAAAKGPRQP